MMSRVAALFVVLWSVAAAAATLQGGSSRLAPRSAVPPDSSSAQSKLYFDQQAAKTRRAEVERTLLLPGVELLEEVLKAQSGSGFGAGTSSKDKAKQLCAALRENGVIRLNHCIKDSTASSLKEHVLEEMESARALISSGQQPPRAMLNSEPERKSRTDFKLSLKRREGKDLKHPVADALCEMFGDGGSLRALYDSLLGPESELYDLGCMTTFPGSDRQTIHADFAYQSEPPMFAIFVALQDVTACMGPTVFLPRTNTAKDCNEWKSASTYDAYLHSKVPSDALLKRGDLVIYDPRTLHCGAANQEEGGSSRSLFNVGFLNPKVSGDFGYQGSLRAAYGNGKITFGRLTNSLRGYKSGGKKDPFDAYGHGLETTSI